MKRRGEERRGEERRGEESLLRKGRYLAHHLFQVDYSAHTTSIAGHNP
jgi:hypothetical protein